MAVLTTMDGGDGEQLRYGRVEAYRALDHLRDKVRICHQAGRVSRRDGTKYPSLALLDRILVPVLHDRYDAQPDIRLLRFMANKAVEKASLSPVAALAASSHKAAQIDKMARLTVSRGCFRESLVGYFTGPKRVARKSISAWLLEFVFADREVTQQRVICCDACQQRLITGQGPIAFVKKVLGE